MPLFSVVWGEGICNAHHFTQISSRERGKTVTQLYASASSSPLAIRKGRGGPFLLSPGDKQCSPGELKAVSSYEKELPDWEGEMFSRGVWMEIRGWGWEQSSQLLLCKVYGFSYFENALPTIDVGSFECAVCISCTVPILRGLKSWRESAFLLFLLWKLIVSLSEELNATKNERENSRQHLDIEKTMRKA